MLIGLDADTQYQDAQVQLLPGDVLIYYTDGFTDAANRSGDRFDEENLTQAFLWAAQNCANPQDILEHLFNRVQEFVGTTNYPKDDMTLIVMQVRPTPLSA
jgi:sigma-B regulation protein RsbU (phosphoserine phosphatase)